jgi:spermidine synthase
MSTTAETRVAILHDLAVCRPAARTAGVGREIYPPVMELVEELPARQGAKAICPPSIHALHAGRAGIRRSGSPRFGSAPAAGQPGADSDQECSSHPGSSIRAPQAPHTTGSDHSTVVACARVAARAGASQNPRQALARGTALVTVSNWRAAAREARRSVASPRVQVQCQPRCPTALQALRLMQQRSDARSVRDTGDIRPLDRFVRAQSPVGRPSSGDVDDTLGIRQGVKRSPPERRLMKQTTLLEQVKTPDGSTMALAERDGEYVIRVNGRELMSTRHSFSEEQLGVVACRARAKLKNVCVLIGGLGLGFTLRAALANLARDARVLVAELVPEVVDWNRNPAYPLAADALADRRTQVLIGDVADVLVRSQDSFDAIMLDADNQTTSMNTAGNTSLYQPAGITKVWQKLKPNGTVVYWSAGEDPLLAKRLTSARFDVEVQRVRKHPTAGGHHILIVGHRRA